MIPEHMADLRAAIHFIADTAIGFILIFWCWRLSCTITRIETRLRLLEAWQTAVWSSDEDRVTDLPGMNSYAVADQANGTVAADKPTM